MRSVLFLSSSILGAAVLAMTGCSAEDPSPYASDHPTHHSSTAGGSGSGTGSGNGDTSSGTAGSTGGSNGGATAGGNGGATAGGGGDTSTISADESWADGKQIASSVTIAAGATVTIADGATITVAAGASITVQGTLKGTSTATHAKLTGTGWTGVIVAMGGSLTTKMVDITGAITALDVSGTAKFDNGIITGASSPFHAEKGGSISTTSSQVTGTVGPSRIEGSFTASRLDYDAGSGEGVALDDAAAVVSIEDSKFHGTGTNGGDMIVSSAAKSIHLAYTEIKQCHCAFHFNDVESFDISWMDVHDDAYGFMMYGSNPTTGTRTVTSSNFQLMSSTGIAEQGTNGAITVNSSYFDTASANLQLVDQEITLTNPQQAAVTGAGPRP